MATKNEQISSFSDRFRSVFELSPYNKSSLGKALGVSHTTISRWLKANDDGNLPNGDVLIQLAELVNVNVHWLLTGEDVEEENEDSGKNNGAISEKESSRYEPSLIPVVGWAHAGEAVAYDEMPEGYLDSMIVPSNLSGQKMFGLIIEGDSMIPEIQHKDRVAVLKEEKPWNGCLVVSKFKEDEGVLIRRYSVISAPSGKPEIVMLSPYNRMYPDTKHHIKDFEWIKPVAFIFRDTTNPNKN